MKKYQNLSKEDLQMIIWYFYGTNTRTVYDKIVFRKKCWQKKEKF